MLLESLTVSGERERAGGEIFPAGLLGGGSDCVAVAGVSAHTEV